MDDDELGVEVVELETSLETLETEALELEEDGVLSWQGPLGADSSLK